MCPLQVSFVLGQRYGPADIGLEMKCSAALAHVQEANCLLQLPNRCRKFTTHTKGPAVCLCTLPGILINAIQHRRERDAASFSLAERVAIF